MDGLAALTTFASGYARERSLLVDARTEEALLSRLRASKSALPRRGKLFLLDRAERLIDDLLALRQLGLEPKRLQVVDAPLEPWVLLEALAARPGGLSVAPPLRCGCSTEPSHVKQPG